MTILLRGLEMPKDEENMSIYIYGTGEVTVDTGDGDTLVGTAVPVPPHGRLIDAEVLCERLLTAWHTADAEGRRVIGEVMANVVTPIVASIPAVIEAEEGNDGN